MPTAPHGRTSAPVPSTPLPRLAHLTCSHSQDRRVWLGARDRAPCYPYPYLPAPPRLLPGLLLRLFLGSLKGFSQAPPGAFPGFPLHPFEIQKRWLQMGNCKRPLWKRGQQPMQHPIPDAVHSQLPPPHLLTTRLAPPPAPAQSLHLTQEADKTGVLTDTVFLTSMNSSTRPAPTRHAGVHIPAVLIDY